MVSTNTQILDMMVRHSIDIMRVEASMKNDAIADLRRLESTLAKRINQHDPSAPAHITMRERRSKTLMAVANEDIDAAYQTLGVRNEQELRALGYAETVNTVDTVNRAITVDLASFSADNTYLKALSSGTLIHGAPQADWWQHQSDTLKFNFMRQMQEGLAQGEGIGELVRRIRGRRENGFRDGIMNTAYNDAATLVRTSAQAVSNKAADDVINANGDVLRGKMWSSTLDIKTSAPCRALDGSKWDLEGNPIEGTELPFLRPPPAHWNCRSRIIPLTKSWDELVGTKDKRILDAIKRAKSPESLRASMDGMVPGELRYSDWLKMKEAANPGFARGILGNTKYELWKNGQLGLSDMIDQSWRPMKVSELTRKVQRSHRKVMRTMPQSPRASKNMKKSNMFKAEYGEPEGLNKEGQRAYDTMMDDSPYHYEGNYNWHHERGIIGRGGGVKVVKEGDATSVAIGSKTRDFTETVYHTHPKGASSALSGPDVYTTVANSEAGVYAFGYDGSYSYLKIQNSHEGVRFYEMYKAVDQATYDILHQLADQDYFDFQQAVTIRSKVIEALAAKQKLRVGTYGHVLGAKEREAIELFGGQEWVDKLADDINKAFIKANGDYEKAILHYWDEVAMVTKYTTPE